MIHCSPYELESMKIEEGELVMLEAETFPNIVELADSVIKKSAFPIFSVTHGTYSKVKINRVQLTNSDGLRIVTPFNRKFIETFITAPHELKLDELHFISNGEPKMIEIENFLLKSKVPIISTTYEQLEKEILTSEIEILYFGTAKVRSSVEETKAAELITSRCVRRIRTCGFGLQYIKRFQKEFDILKHYGMLGMFMDVEKLSSTFVGILRGSANNSLICFLLEIGQIDPVRFDLPFERFVNVRKIFGGIK